MLQYYYYPSGATNLSLLELLKIRLNHPQASVTLHYSRCFEYTTEEFASAGSGHSPLPEPTPISARLRRNKTAMLNLVASNPYYLRKLSGLFVGDLDLAVAALRDPHSLG